MTPLRQSAFDFMKAWTAFSEQINALPEDNPYRHHWDYLDWQEAGSTVGIAEDVFTERHSARFNWIASYHTKYRGEHLADVKFADLTNKQSADMAHKLSNGRWWKLTRKERTSPVPEGAEEICAKLDSTEG